MKRNIDTYEKNIPLWGELDDEELSIAISAAMYVEKEDISEKINRYWLRQPVVYPQCREALIYYWKNYDNINIVINNINKKQKPIEKRKNLIEAMEI